VYTSCSIAFLNTSIIKKIRVCVFELLIFKCYSRDLFYYITFRNKSFNILFYQICSSRIISNLPFIAKHHFNGESTFVLIGKFYALKAILIEMLILIIILDCSKTKQKPIKLILRYLSKLFQWLTKLFYHQTNTIIKFCYFTY
jgi:hypothetical protein